MNGARRRLAAAGMVALLLGGCGEGGVRVEPAGNPAAGFAESADPVLASDPATGELLAGFVARGADSTWQLYFARSADAGASWTTPSQVTRGAGEIKPHGEASPRLVAAPGGRVAFVWPEEVIVAGRKWPASRMRFARSLDGGTSWTGAVTINDDTTGAPAGHTFHGATWTGGEGIVAAWLDERRGGTVAHEHGAEHDHASAEGDATVYAVSSTDFGATWSANRPLWGAACPCCRVTLAHGDSGLVGAWRKHFPGDVRDVVVASFSESPGTEPSAPSRVHDDSWVYPGCPHTGPALAVGEDGIRHVAWYTGRPGAAGVYLVRSDPRDNHDPSPIALVRGTTLPTAHPAVHAMSGNASLVAWDIDAAGKKRISVAHVNGGARRATAVPVPETEGGSYPQLAGHAGGPVLVAWTRVEEGRQRIGVARIVLGK